MAHHRSLDVWVASQDGSKHYLMCDPCEQHMGTAEDYLSNLMKGTTGSLARIGISARNGIVEGANPEMIQRGVCAISLKAHAAPSVPHTEFHLVDSILPVFREGALTGRSARFAIAANRWTTRVPGWSPRGNCHLRSLSWGDPGAEVGAVELMFYGWSWYLWWNNGEPTPPWKLESVTTSGWKVLTADATQSMAFHEGDGPVGLPDWKWRAYAKHLGKAKARDLDPGRNDRCNCGSDRKYKHCCLGIWASTL